MKRILATLLSLPLLASAYDPGVEAARRGTLSSQSNVVVDVKAAELIGPYVDGALVSGAQTNRLLTTASAGVRNPYGLRYGPLSGYMSYTGASVMGLFFGDGLSWTSDGTNGTVSLDGTYLAGLGYALASDVSTALSGKQGTLSGSQLAAAGSGITQAKREGYDAHLADADVHVTVAQKEAWTAKQDALTPAQTNAVDSGITAEELELLETHRSDRTIHINEEFLEANATKEFVTGKVAKVASDFASATQAMMRAQARLPGIASLAKARDHLFEARAEWPSEGETEAALRPSLPLGTAFARGAVLAADCVAAYSDDAAFAVTAPADAGSHAVMGVAMVPGLTNAKASKPEWDAGYAAIPHMLVSGVNDAGLAAAFSAYPASDGRAWATNAYPSATTQVKPWCLVSQALRRFSSATNAAAEMAAWGVPLGSDWNVHVMLADESGAVRVVEFAGGANRVVVSPVMSDFGLYGCSFQPVSGRVVASSVQAYGLGLERHDLARDALLSVTNAADAAAVLDALRWTKLYTDVEHPRYTDVCGMSAELTVTADRALFASALAQVRNWYAYRTREDGRTRQSAVSVAYDLSGRKMLLTVQELGFGSVSYEYSFPGGSGVSEEWLVEQGFVRESDLDPRLEPLEQDVVQLKSWRETAEPQIAGKQDALTEAQTNAVNSGITSSKRSGYDTHVSNGDIHVTTSQKSAWSAKQDALTTAQTNAINSGITSSKRSGYDTHVANNDIHVTAAQKTAWSAKQDALTTAQMNAVNSGATSGKVATWDGYGGLIASLQATKVDADDVYTKGEIELVVLRNLVRATITNHLSNLTWDDSYHVMWKKRADAGCFYETAYTNVNVLVEGNP